MGDRYLFFQAEDGIRAGHVTGVQTCALPICGPRGGFIICREEFAKAIDKTVFPGMQGGPLMHVIAAKAVAFKEALSDRSEERRVGKEGRARWTRGPAGGNETKARHRRAADRG